MAAEAVLTESRQRDCWEALRQQRQEVLQQALQMVPPPAQEGMKQWASYEPQSPAGWLLDIDSIRYNAIRFAAANDEFIAFVVDAGLQLCPPSSKDLEGLFEWLCLHMSKQHQQWLLEEAPVPSHRM